MNRLNDDEGIEELLEGLFDGTVDVKGSKKEVYVWVRIGRVSSEARIWAVCMEGLIEDMKM